MTTQRSFLFGYRLLLQLYPGAFRRRFASEMLELAEAAEPTEWPLIFGDTSVAIIRCWFEGTRSAAATAEPNAYVSVGGFPVSGLGLLQGLVLSIAMVVGVCYVNDRWAPSYSYCPGTSSQNVRR